MSKVFSAKRKTVVIDYEFLDETTTTLTVRSLSTKEQMQYSNTDVKDTESIVKRFKGLIQTQLKNNNADIVEKVINEQYEDGDLIQFSNDIAGLVEEEKAKKQKDL